MEKKFNVITIDGVDYELGVGSNIDIYTEDNYLVINTDGTGNGSTGSGNTGSGNIGSSGGSSGGNSLVKVYDGAYTENTEATGEYYINDITEFVNYLKTNDVKKILLKFSGDYGYAYYTASYHSVISVEGFMDAISIYAPHDEFLGVQLNYDSTVATDKVNIVVKTKDSDATANTIDLGIYSTLQIYCEL